MRVLVTFAVEAEFAPWRSLREFRKVRINEKHWSDGIDVLQAQIGENTVSIFLTGIGIKCLDFKAARHFETGEVDAVISSGLAGALKAEHEIGEIVAPRRVGTLRDASGVSAASALLAFAEKKGAKLVETLLTSHRIIETGAEKSRLAMFGDAVDMESFHVMREFFDHGIPVATIRAISDGSDEDLPMDFSKTITSQGHVKFGSMLKELAGRPGKIPDLVRFGQQSKDAARRLATYLDSFVQGLTSEVLVAAQTGASANG
jgi:nucleoside phosphorylase